MEEIARSRHRLLNELASFSAGADAAMMTEKARQFSELEEIYLVHKKVQGLLHDLEELEGMAAGGGDRDGEAIRLLCAEYKDKYAAAAGRLKSLLRDKGYLRGDVLDDTDLDILEFIAYAGPEYAWRLGINIGIGTEEARRRLALLLEKGLLEKVQGTMLEGYHREKSWVKHMNHTYYRLSRQGGLFLRQMRRGPGRPPAGKGKL